MDQHVKRERLKRKICDVVSVHKQIVEKDEEIEIKLQNPSFDCTEPAVIVPPPDQLLLLLNLLGI